MKRKIIALCLIVAMLGVAVISGTMAYFTDTAEAVNVMTIGSVKIELIEEKRAVDANGDVILGADDKPQMETLDPNTGYQMVPAVYSDYAWADNNASANDKVFHPDMKNVYDKFVSVKNTGRSDAYVRLFFAFEDTNNVSDKLHISNTYTFNPVKNPDTQDVLHTEIDGVIYEIYSCTYAAPVKAGETSEYSLKQFFFNKDTTNEDVEAAGEEYTILVLAQAVQASGFDDADTALNAGFGVPNAATEDTTDGDTLNVEAWFGNLPVRVTNDAELKAAIEAGETKITLAKAGTYHMPAAAKGKTLTINGAHDAIIEVVPAGQGEANGQLDYSLDGSKVTFNGVTIKTNSQLYAGFARLSAVYNDCVIQNTYNLGVGTSEFNNCTFNITNEYLRVGGASSAVFNGCTFNTDGRAILVYQDGTNVAQTVTVKDCTFNATAAAHTWNSIHVAAVSIDGTNGTYVVNLEGNNVVDSDFNGLWQIKAGEANVTVNK